MAFLKIVDFSFRRYKSFNTSLHHVLSNSLNKIQIITHDYNYVVAKKMYASMTSEFANRYKITIVKIFSSLHDYGLICLAKILH